MSVQSYLSAQKAGSRGEEWVVIEDCYQKKLWHQLTIAVLKFIKQGPHQKGDMDKLYNVFVKDFEHRVGTLSNSALAPN